MTLPPGLMTGKTMADGLAAAQHSVKRGGRHRHEAGKMNKLETAYAWDLDIMLKAGEIKGWWFESVKLRVAERTFYTPDFLVWYPDRLELVDTKGFVEDDAAVKIRVCRDKYPMFVFRVLVREGNGWREILK